MAERDAEPRTVVAPDGSPVEVYRRLPAGHEPERIHGAIPAGAGILELGCGAGRLTRPLAALGHHVTAVDNEPAMLAEIAGGPAIQPIEGDVASLDLDRRFAAVVLASHFVNTPSPDGEAFLRTVARHLAPDGLAFIEAYPPGLDWAAGIGRRTEVGPVGITLESARLDVGSIDAVVVYDVDGRSWRQPFRATLLDEAALRQRLDAGGLRFGRWLDKASGWLTASLAPGA